MKVKEIPNERILKWFQFTVANELFHKKAKLLSTFEDFPAQRKHNTNSERNTFKNEMRLNKR